MPRANARHRSESGYGQRQYQQDKCCEYGGCVKIFHTVSPLLRLSTALPRARALLWRSHRFTAFIDFETRCTTASSFDLVRILVVFLRSTKVSQCNLAADIFLCIRRKIARHDYSLFSLKNAQLRLDISQGESALPLQGRGRATSYATSERNTAAYTGFSFGLAAC